jgi:hypothetical protein
MALAVVALAGTGLRRVLGAVFGGGHAFFGAASPGRFAWRQWGADMGFSPCAGAILSVKDGLAGGGGKRLGCGPQARPRGHFEEEGREYWEPPVQNKTPP